MKLRNVLLVTSVLLTTGCASTGGFVTSPTQVERRLCIIWHDTLPTASSRDTTRTKTEIADAADVQAAVCE